MWKQNVSNCRHLLASACQRLSAGLLGFDSIQAAAWIPYSMFEDMAIAKFMVGGLRRDIRQNSAFSINTNNSATKLSLKGCNRASFCSSAKPGKKVEGLSNECQSADSKNKQHNWYLKPEYTQSGWYQTPMGDEPTVVVDDVGMYFVLVLAKHST